MRLQIKHLYVFGPFRFDPTERLLLRDGRPVPLSPKLSETLFLLVQDAGHLVGKDELMKGLWPDAFVEEGNLNKNIFVLRKTLGQWDGGLEYIETVSKRGYRFVAPVVRVAKTETGPQVQTASVLNANEGTSARTTPWIWATLAMGAPLLLALIVVAAWHMNWRRREPASSFTPAIHSLAVLPLEDLSDDPSQNYFADGMTDELITRLGQLNSLRVISRTSAMQYRGVHKPLPQIAHELNVDAIVEGTVVRSGGKVRITAQLIQAPADKHLWAQSYDGDLKDVLSLQNAIANAIAKQIRINLTPREQIRLGIQRPVSPQGYELYLRGEYLLNKFTPDSIRQAANSFQKAIDKDPIYVPAYAKLAGCYQILANMAVIPRETAVPKVKFLLAKALELDPDFGPAHAVRGWILMLEDLNFTAAGTEFKRAVELSPNTVEGHEGLGDYYATIGQPEEAVLELERAREVDPLASIVNFDLCQMLYFARQYDDALAQCTANLDLDPNPARALRQLAAIYAAKRMDSEATAAFLRSLEVAGAPPAVITAAKRGANDFGLSGYWKALIPFMLENADGGEPNPWTLAVAYASTGNNDKALLWLGKAIDARCFGVTYLRVDPTFDSLRSDSRFQNLLHRMGPSV